MERRRTAVPAIAPSPVRTWGAVLGPGGLVGNGGKGGPMNVHIDLAALALIVSITLMVGMILGVSLSRPRR